MLRIVVLILALASLTFGQNVNKVLAGPAAAPDAPPTWRSLVPADLNFLYGTAPGSLLVTRASGADPATDNCVKWLAGGKLGDAGSACSGGGGAGDVTAVGDCATGACYQTATANYVYAGPATGAAAPAALRALVSADIPNNAANTSGNAATATALAANPTDCGAGEFANAIAASGNLTCAVPAGGGGTVLDLAVTKTAAAVLTIAAGNAGFGSTVYTFASATATITAGTGTAYIYVASDGTLTVAHNVTVTCSGCTQTAGTAFPADSIPLYTWTATATVWDTAGGTNYRAPLSAKKVAAGTGVQVSEASGHATVAIDSSVVPTLTSTSALTGKTIDAEATGNVITTVQKAWLQAATCTGATANLNWDTIATLAPATACTAGTTNTGLIRGLAAFSNSEISQMQTHFALPSDWTGAVDLKFKWQTSAITGSVVWQAATVCVADAEVNDAAWNTASTVTDVSKGTTLQTNDAAITGLTATGCAAGEMLHLKVFRDPAHASDDLAATADLVGVEVTLRRAQ